MVAVSVVMRTRDRLLLLERAIASVRGQRFADWELVIVNDGGAPAPVDALVQVAGDARIRVLHRTTSRGMEGASNAGLAGAHGRFVAIHDDDDSWEPDFLAACVDYLEQPGAPPGVVTHSVLVREELHDGRVIERVRDPRFNAWLREVSLMRLAAVNSFPPISFVYARSVLADLGGYREDLPVLGDWEFNLRFRARHPIGVLPRPLARYHVRPAAPRATVNGALANSVGGPLHREWDQKLRAQLWRSDPKLGALVRIAPVVERATSTLFRAASTLFGRPDGVLPTPLVGLIDRHPILSLDVFDTALLRAIDAPPSVFALVESEYRRTHGRLSGFDFTSERRTAERRARRRAWDEEQRGDIGLDEIYAAVKVPPDWNAGELRVLEVEIEAALVRPNPFVQALYAHARALGRRVVFVSDMYLPRSFFERALADAGYDAHDGLYVSGSLGGRTKHSSQLYGLVADELGAGRHELLHVGDHPWADVAMALRAGCGAWLYERCSVRGERNGPTLAGDEPSAMVMRGLAYNRLEAHRAAPSPASLRIGYGQLGPAWSQFDGDSAAIARALGSAGLAEALERLLGDREIRRAADEFRADFARLRTRFSSLAQPPPGALGLVERALRRLRPR
jgi:FMN phosphatase YigB (HAD superfamily)